MSAQIRKGIGDGVTVKPADYLKIPCFKRLWYGLSFLGYRRVMRLITLNAYV